MKRLMSLLIIAVMIFATSSIIVFAAGEPESDAMDDMTDAVSNSVGIILPTRDESRWVLDEERFRETLEEGGYDVEILFSEKDPARERANVDTLISRGVQVIIMTPVDAEAAGAAAEEAARNGVTVISYDRLITGTSAVDYYITFNSFNVGAAFGQYLVDNVSGSGNNLYLYAGAATDNNAFIFFDGAWSVLQPRIADGTFVIQNSSEAVALSDTLDLSREQLGQIISQVTTDWNGAVARNLADSHLTAVGPEAKGDVFIAGPNDDTARAIADAFAADPDVTSYYVTGQDATRASIQYIIDGRQSMTVFKDVRFLVDDAIATAIAVLEGREPNVSTTYNNGVIDVPSVETDVTTVTRENLQEEIFDSGFYSASDFTGL